MIATLSLGLLAVCLFVLLPCVPLRSPMMRMGVAFAHTVVAVLALWCWYQWQLTDVPTAQRVLGMLFVGIIVFFADYNIVGSAPEMRRRTPVVVRRTV